MTPLFAVPKTLRKLALGYGSEDNVGDFLTSNWVHHLSGNIAAHSIAVPVWLKCLMLIVADYICPGNFSLVSASSWLNRRSYILLILFKIYIQQFSGYPSIGLDFQTTPGN